MPQVSRTHIRGNGVMGAHGRVGHVEGCYKSTEGIKKATYLFDAQCCVRCQLCHPQDVGSHVRHDLAMAMLFQYLGMQRRAAWEDRGCWEGERSTRIRKKSEVKKMKEKKKAHVL